MKRTIFVSILAATTLSAGCELPDPVRVGDACPGITLDHIIWTDSDPCMAEDDGKEACNREAEEVIHLGKGYCPERFVCRENKEKEPICLHGCAKGKVLCGEDCVDPAHSMSHCGAKVEGLCNNDAPDNDNYKGEDCLELIFKSFESKDYSVYMCDHNERCKKTDCALDEYWKRNDSDGACIKNDNDNCGGEGIKCAADETCTIGECLKKCKDGHIRCYVPGEGNLCIDPKSDNAFCGAKGKCLVEDDPQSEDYRGVACNNAEGMYCALGSCKLLECKNENEKTCGNQCVDVRNNPSHCGDCNINCANNRPPHTTDDVRCEDHKCIYTCETGYENCSTEGKTECVDLTEDRKNCGTCGRTCEPNKYCHERTCKIANCSDAYACFKPASDACFTNDPEQCGIDCTPCNNTLNASEATCDDLGVCHVIRCQPDHHFVSETQACEPNTPSACGSVDKSDVTDCTAIPNISDAQCTYGECTCTCDTNHHKNRAGTGCEINTADDCGESHAVCNVANANNTCTTDGQCTFTCDTNHHKNRAGTGCEINSVNDCGASHAVCNVANATTNTCTSDGKCTFTCAPNHHKNRAGTGCEINSVNDCGASHAVCNVANANNACTSDGKCTFTCEPDYCPDKSGRRCSYTDFDNDIINCGECGRFCDGIGEVCSFGVCTLASSQECPRPYPADCFGDGSVCCQTLDGCHGGDSECMAQ